MRWRCKVCRSKPRSRRQLSQLIPSNRNAVHAAKSMKDVYGDLELFKGSVNDRFNAYFGQFREVAREFYEGLDTLQTSDMPTLRFEALVEGQEQVGVNTRPDAPAYLRRGLARRAQ